MKQIKRIMIVVLALVLAVSLSLTAFAATASQDGLELSVTTDKTSYSATEQVTVTVTVKNTNAFAVSNVAVESSVPDGYMPADGYSSTKNIATLGAGETATLTVVYVPESSGKPGGSNYPQFPWWAPGVLPGTTTNPTPSYDETEYVEDVVEVDQPTEGNTNVFEEATVTAKRNVGLWVLVAVVSAGALIAVLAGKKRLKKTMSIMLCVAMVGTLATVLPVEANATVMPIEAGGVKNLSAETEISVAGETVRVSASVQYVLDFENPNPITYTVTFAANGENVENLPEPQKVKEGECAVEPVAPSREGFDFTGWYTDEKAETPFDFSSKITSDIVLYAGWKEIVKPDVYYTVTFEANGENVENLPEPQKVKEGESAVEPVAPSREGFDFTGWYTDEKAETSFDFSSKITSDLVLYAGWKEIVKPDVYYTVTFEANGENVENLPEPQKVKEGECAVEPVAPSREGFDFTGWYTDEKAETPFDFSSKITSDIVLYAGWKEIVKPDVYHTVTFEANGENVKNLPEPQKVKEGECAVEPVAPSREGFDFTGWYTDEKAETPFDFSSKITSDIVLYAGWKEIVKPDVYYTVTFEANGENVENLPEPQKAKEGECAVEPIAPSREGFDFTGWYADKAAETPFDFSSKITSDIVLYAVWREIVKPDVYYTVTFEANGENVENLPEPQKVKEGECAVEPVVPSREGYIFVGWKISTSNAIYNFNASVFGDIVLVAIWSVDYENGDSLYEISNDNVKYDKTENVFYTENIVIAFIKNGLSNSQKQNIVDSVGGILVGELSGDINILQIQVQSESLSYLSSICSQLSLNSDVYYATCDYPIPSQEISDNSSANTGNITEGNWWYELIGAEEASKLSQKYVTVPKIGVIDSGVESQHPELAGKIHFVSPYFQTLNNTRFPDVNHGTHVSGIIAASNDNVGMTGVIPNCEIEFGIFGGETAKSWHSDLTELYVLKCAIEKGCRVINCSFGVYYYDEQFFESEKQKEVQSGIPVDERQYNYDSYEDFTASRWNARTKIVEMVTAATCDLIIADKPFLIIQAAGNGINNYEDSPGVDAKATSYWAGIIPEISEPICQKYNVDFSDLDEHFLIVGGITKEHDGNTYEINTCFNYGDTVDICAPSVDIYSSVYNEKGNKYVSWAGTSMATPIVTGTAALIWAINPELSSKDVQKILKEYTRYSAEATINGKLYQYPVVDTLSSAKAALKLVYGDVYERGTNNLIYDAKATLTGLTEDKQAIEVSEYAHAGSFEIRIPNDMVSDIKLTVSCDGYEDYVYPLGISPNTSTDVGDIYLNSKSPDVDFPTVLIGTVVDADTDSGLEGVEISVYDETDTDILYTQSTDNNGNFSIEAEEAGNYIVHCSKEEYIEYAIPVTLIEGTETSIGYVRLEKVKSDEDIIYISTPEELDGIRNNLKGHYVLKNDIDLSAYDVWTPIGYLNRVGSFEGIFDGAGHSITGLSPGYFSIPDGDYSNTRYYLSGLFGHIGPTSIIKNVNVYVNVTLYGAQYYGTIVAIAQAGSLVENCTVYGSISILNNMSTMPDHREIEAGGIVGEGGGTIKDCKNYANIQVESNYLLYVGGILGFGTDVEHCYNEGNINCRLVESTSAGGAVYGVARTAHNSCNAANRISFYNEYPVNELLYGLCPVAGGCYNCAANKDMLVNGQMISAEDNANLTLLEKSKLWDWYITH